MIDTLTNMYFSCLLLLLKIFLIFIIGIAIAFAVSKILNSDE